MEITLPLVIIAVGSVALVALRDWRLLVAALVVQWGGLGLLLLDLMPGGRAGWLELTTALVSGVVLGWTVLSLHNVNPRDVRGLDEAERDSWQYRRERKAQNARQEGLADQALLWVTALAGGVAGFGLARLYSLGGPDDAMLAFYWIVLSGALSMVVHGARDLMKVGTGLVVVLNAVALLVETMTLGSLSDVTLGLFAACRLAVVVLISYLLVVLKVKFLDADLDDLFDTRAGSDAGEMAIVAAGDAYYYAGSDEEVVEAEREEETTQARIEDEDEVPAGG